MENNRNAPTIEVGNINDKTKENVLIVNGGTVNVMTAQTTIKDGVPVKFEDYSDVIVSYYGTNGVLTEPFKMGVAYTFTAYISVNRKNYWLIPTDIKDKNHECIKV
ncbi:MAG: hypothetical protein IJR59_01495 [Firmicutes bacterium]|nr:hypothetical protein [Bacillota bacterium]